MPTTDRLGWKYPTEEQRDWWQVWMTLINQMDADVWASFENAFIVLKGGGSVYLDTVGDQLVWTEDLYLLNTLSGGTVRLPAGSVSFDDGDIAYVDITRPLSSNYDSTMQVSSTPLVGSTQRNTVFVAIRTGDELVMCPWQSNPPVRIFEDTIQSGSIAGASWEREIDLGAMDSGKVHFVELVLAVGASTDTDVEIYDDDPSGTGEVIFQELGINLTSANFKSINVWWMKAIVAGSIWVKITNNTASASTYDFTLRVEGDQGEVYGE